MQKNLLDFEVGKDFIKDTQSKVSCKLGFVYIKNFYSSKDCQKLKRQITDWEKIYAIHISDKELVSEFYKEPFINQKFKNLHFKKMNDRSEQTLRKRLYAKFCHHQSPGKCRSKLHTGMAQTRTLPTPNADKAV